jgi:protease secretion system membrane fusion protein
MTEKLLFEQEADSVGLASQPDARRVMRLGLSVLLVAFGGFVLWAAFAPLDEGVPTMGMVAIDTKSKPIQHLSGGLVNEILVKEGQFVEVGEVVMRLDAALSRAEYESLHQKYMGLRAMQSRLIAQQNGADSIRFTDDVLSSMDPMVQLQVSTQRTLFNSGKLALEAEIRGILESISGQESSIQGYQGQLSSQQQQEKLLLQELDGVRQLVEEAYAPRSKQLELERMLASTQGAIVELSSNVNRSRRMILELHHRIEQRRQEVRKETDQELAAIRLEIEGVREKYQAASEQLNRTELRSPVSGQVVGLAVQTPGAIVQPGQKLMDIVPLDEYLLLETKVPPHMIDRVEVGQKTDVRFNAFSHSPSLVAEGEVRSLSRDLVTEDGPAGPISFYLARISLTDAGMKTLGNRQLQAGMPAEVIIKTGERSLLTYILNPLTKRIAASMKEE